MSREDIGRRHVDCEACDSLVRKLERAREALRVIAVWQPCGCAHDNENCCAKVAEPCATCALAELDAEAGR